MRDLRPASIIDTTGNHEARAVGAPGLVSASEAFPLTPPAMDLRLADRPAWSGTTVEPPGRAHAPPHGPCSRRSWSAFPAGPRSSRPWQPRLRAAAARTGIRARAPESRRRRVACPPPAPHWEKRATPSTAREAGPASPGSAPDVPPRSPCARGGTLRPPTAGGSDPDTLPAYGKES